MMMAYGMFVFSLKTLPYQALQHQLAWRHPTNPRVGYRPARQFLGPDDETIILNGIVLPELTGGQLSLDTLRLIADQGKAWPLIEGTGKIYGLYVVEEFSASKTVFCRDGAARQIEFGLTLKRVEDNDLSHLGMLTSLPSMLS